ncbi:MAG: transglutaminase domain-containing protein [Candidatus Altarchaeaceae archaeon]
MEGYFPENKSLLSLKSEEIGYSEINVTFHSIIQVENDKRHKQSLTVYIPYPMESKRQNVSLNVYMEISNSTYNINSSNCNCSDYFCCEIVNEKFDTKRVKITFKVPKGIFNLSYNVVEKVRINNTIPVTSLNITANIAQNRTLYQYLKQYLKYDEWANYDENIKNFAINLTKNLSSDFEKVSKIATWIYNNIEYDLSKADVFQNSSETFSSRKGVCTHFTNLFLSMCRSIGIPARGIAGEIFNETDYISGHAWAEVFIDDWYPVDPTFGEIGIVDSGRVAFSSDLSVSTLLYFDMDATHLKLIDWSIEPEKTDVIDAKKFENLINLTPDYEWINKTISNDIINGTLKIIAEIFRLDFPYNILGMISIIPPIVSHLNISFIINETTNYFILEENKNSTNVTFVLNVTNINLSENIDYIFPIVVHSLLSNVSILNVTTFPKFLTLINLKAEGNNYTINLTVKNEGLRDGYAQLKVNFDNKLYEQENLFIEGTKQNSTQFSFNDVKGFHTVEIFVNENKFRFVIGSCKGDVNLDYKIDLNDAFELMEILSNVEEINFANTQKECIDFDNNDFVDVFDVVGILEYLANI